MVCTTAAQAQNQTFTIKGKSVDLPTPSGFCIPDTSRSREATFAKNINALMGNSGSKVVKMAADCGELKQNGRIYDYVVYYYPTSTENETLEGGQAALRKALCDDFRKQGDASVSDVPEIVAKTAKELNENMTTSKVTVIGVLAEDAHGCYDGLLSSVGDSQGHFIMNVDVLGTILHNHTFFVALYSQYQSAAESKKSLQRLQAIAADLDARNPD